MSGARIQPVHGSWPQPPALRAWLAERSDGARLHAGVDLGHRGEVVYAPEDGTVSLVGEANYADHGARRSAPRGFAGYGPAFLVLAGDSGFFHLLAHLEVGSVRVAQGARVVAGDELALVSQLGDHVHWEVRRMVLPPAGAATVEVCDDPSGWLAYSRRPWTAIDCPRRPIDATSTPRACQPRNRGRTFAELVPVVEAGEPRPTRARPLRRKRDPASGLVVDDELAAMARASLW